MKYDAALRTRKDELKGSVVTKGSNLADALGKLEARICGMVLAVTDQSLNFPTSIDE